MSKTSFKKCEWFEGAGIDKELLAIGGVKSCWDCEGTGFEGGLKAQKEYLLLKNEELEALEKNLDL